MGIFLGRHVAVWTSFVVVAGSLGLGACGDDDGGGSGGGGGSGADAGAAGEAGSGGGSTGGGSGTTGGSGGSGGSTGGMGAMGGQTPTTEPVALADVPQEFATTLCAIQERCVPFLFDFLSVTEADCVAEQQKGFEEGGWDATLQAIDDGTVEYDEDAARECLDELEGIACDELDAFRYLETCEGALQGTLEEDDECKVDEECAGDLICGGDSCPQTCVSRSEEDGACFEDGDCADGLYCEEEACVAYAEEDGNCEGGSAPRCAPGLFCLGQNEGNPGACVPYGEVFTAEEGDTCDLSEGPLCERGLSCAYDAEAEDPGFSCQQPAGGGEPCTLGLPDMCPTGQYCAGVSLAPLDLEGNCVTLPGDDEDCEALFNRCESGTTCVDGTCVKRLDNGEDCAPNGDNAACYSNFCASGECTAPVCP